MRFVSVISDSIISPLGNSSEENYDAIRNGRTGIKLHANEALSQVPVHASIMAAPAITGCTRFESIAIEAVQRATENLDLDAGKTLFVLSTTKGNIELLATHEQHPRLSLHGTAKHVADQCGFRNVQVVSNACISGSLAMLVAQRALMAGHYDHAIVVGAEVLSRFIISGFQSLHALSAEPCRPFDQSRAGITLGEASACVVLSATHEGSIRITGGGLSNDANHISGPSRTGKELSVAIDHAMKSTGLPVEEIDFISAHGTATLYNDEMEAKAFAHSFIQHKPVHSLKGYYGHTLGAAGVVESVIALHALNNNELIPSKGFSTLGVSEPLNVIQRLEKKSLRRVLKTASGFGGCNAAIILEKV